MGKVRQRKGDVGGEQTAFGEMEDSEAGEASSAVGLMNMEEPLPKRDRQRLKRGAIICSIRDVFYVMLHVVTSICLVNIYTTQHYPLGSNRSHAPMDQEMRQGKGECTISL